MAEGFGSAARLWAARVPVNLALIAADVTVVPAALARAAVCKRNGKSIAAALFMPELRSLVAIDNAAKLLAQARCDDERDLFFTALAAEQLQVNGVNQRDWISHDASLIAAAREFLSACDIWVTRSETELQRIAQFFSSIPDTLNSVGFMPDTILHAAPLDPLVPFPPPNTEEPREGIVVWAPRSTPDQCALFAFALDALRVPVAILCGVKAPALPGLHPEFHRAAESGAILARAAVIVDASVDDPGSALALARYGVPLAAACTSGAHEWLNPIQLYAPWSTRSIYDAALTALGGRAAHPTRPDDGLAEIERSLGAADNALPTAGPLVSIVIPTYNRRDRLRDALHSVADQRYTTIETIVVNDGGEDVADIVAGFPRVRLVENERNLGVTPSINAGIAAAGGEYLGFLADDDFLQPDHVARLVAALERSGLDFAHSKELALHYDVGASGKQVLRGHHIGAPFATHPNDMLVSNRIGGPGVMVRRRALEAVGRFDPEMRHGSDFEMWMRLSRRYDFVFVNHITAQVSMRNDKSQLSSVSGTETAEIMKRIYAKHPVARRPVLEAVRTRMLAFCGQQTVVRSAPVRCLAADDLRELQNG